MSRSALASFVIFFSTLSLPQAGLAETGAATGLRSVNRADVCMAVNRIPEGEEIIDLTLDKKSYHVCCPGCAERITKNKDMRFAKDPVTGKKVDKARAYTVADFEGAILYFESRKTAERYFNMLEGEK